MDGGVVSRYYCWVVGNSFSLMIPCRHMIRSRYIICQIEIRTQSTLNANNTSGQVGK